MNIGELGSRAGQEVVLRGWLYHRRVQGKIAFLLLRDGTGVFPRMLYKIYP